MIKITCTKKQGRYRAGVFHPHGVTEHDDKTFNKNQLAAIDRDPVLSVETVKSAGKKKSEG